MPAAGQRAYWRLGWFGLAGVLLGLDQWSKYLVSSRLGLGERVELLPFLDLTYALNTGAAFSFLAGAGGWQRLFLAGVGLLVSLLLVVWIWRQGAHDKRLSAGLALLLGGALGNLVDRVRLGYVEDFILLHWQGWHFPAFNVADSAITLGAVLLIVDALWPVTAAGAKNTELE